jgi:hypothetical protein
MKICLLMFYDDNIKAYGDINYKINKLYCEKYGLDIIVSNNILNINRLQHYQRLYLILKYIDNYDYIMWIDADAFFYIDSSNIVDIINNNPEKDFIFSNDISTTNINTGFFIVKSTNYSKDFINIWAYDEELYNNNSCPWWYDQGILIDMYEKNILDIQKKSIIYDYGILQSFNEKELTNLSINPYIYHMAGYSNEERLSTFIKFFNKYFIENKIYSWENNTIIFLNNNLMDAFGIGYYKFIDINNIKSNFGKREHILNFNDNYTQFTSTRKDDNYIVNGTIQEFEFNKINLLNEYNSYDNIKKNILNDLKNIILESNTPLEGNSFYSHTTLDLYSCLYTKQCNLFWCGKQAYTRICEIGFNAGHSTMLMLLGRDKSFLNFTIFDIGHHAYTKPCLKYIESKFDYINFEYIEGDSKLTMQNWILNNESLIGSYDVVHVDGGHSEDCISNDIKNADILLKYGGILIIDDTNASHINKYVDMYISDKNYRELHVLKSEGYQHRIIKKINKNYKDLSE